jgi:hypothetical protein
MRHIFILLSLIGSAAFAKSMDCSDQFWTCTLPSADVMQCTNISLGDQAGEGNSKAAAYQNLYDSFQNIPECQEFIRQNPTEVSCTQMSD